MSPNTAQPCRLRVLLARRAPVGIIFRRGPSNWVQLIKWNTKTDKFEAGHWLHGHIYAGRSDLSPDGSLLIYFARKMNRKQQENREYTYAWTAISKPPYLTALALWPKGDCWHGGGLFETNNRVMLNHRPEDSKPHPNHLPKGVRVKPNPDAAGEDDPIEIPRSERDGWVFTQWLQYDYKRRVTVKPCIFEKRHPNKRLVLIVAKSFARNQEAWTCEILDSMQNRLTVGTGTWADWDQQGQLVFAANGKLFRGAVKRDHVELKQVADFNSSKPVQFQAPKWAQRW